MLLSKEQLLEIFHGAIRTTEEDGWIQFYRMTEKQMEAEKAYKHFLQSHSASGMFLEFTGDVKKIEFDYEFFSTTKNCFQYSMDVLEDGKLTYSLTGDKEATVTGHFYYVPKGGKRITIRFPWRKQLRLINVDIEGEWRKTDRKIKTLILGDSITHGTWSDHVSNTYASQLSDGLMLESVVQAIGGEAMYEDVLDPDLPFKPDLITVAYGTNDYSLFQDCVEKSDRYFKKLRSIFPEVPIVYLLPIYRFDIEDKAAIRGFTLEDARKGYREKAEKYGIRVVNARDFIPHDRAYFKDGLHPNDLGFSVMGPNVIKAVKEAVPELFGKEPGMNKEKLKNAFAEVYGAEPEAFVFSPGRVNMIGEHTDYNGGHVFPAALTIGTYFAARKRDDKLVRFFSGNFPQNGIVERTLENVEYNKAKGFTNYPMGMIWAFEKKLGLKAETGMDVYLWGNIPNASGLSSSASVEVGMGKILCELFGFQVENKDIALIGQYSENNYNGVNCGIMDQFSIAMGKKDCAIFLDCATLEYQYAPLKLEGMKVVISCTNKKRGLQDSKYNERRSECETALSELQTVADIKSLGELTGERFEAIKDAIKDPVRVKRARHAVLENERTVKAVQMLSEGDVEGFGKLMNASHVSLRDDYEVTGIELDTLAETSWTVPGCIGARMTGAGFGGCAVAIVKEDAVEDYIKIVGDAYLKKIGYKADFYVVDLGDGTHAL